MLIVPGMSGHKLCTVVKDVREAPDESEFTTIIQQSIDELDSNLSNIFNTFKLTVQSENRQQLTESPSNFENWGSWIYETKKL